MSNTPDLTLCVDSEGDGQLPVDPYRSLRVHFGMLLGVDDFATLDAYHRGKMWLHSAWSHGPGTVWGLAVSLNSDRGEIRVAPGLAIDALGRELHLEADACVNLARWFEQHRAEPKLIVEELSNGAVRFDAHVVVQFKACLARQVPALSASCEGSGQTTAYSRTVETVDLLLVPGPAPSSQPPLPYHRLRLLFRLEEPRVQEGIVIESDRAVIERRELIHSAPFADQPAMHLKAFREFAALDELELRPAATEGGDERSLFPAFAPAPLVLAELTGLTLSAAQGGTMTDGSVDNTVRRTLVASSTVQELLCGRLSGIGEDAGGPRIDSASVAVEAASIRFRMAVEPPRPASIQSATSVSLFDEATGWAEAVIQSAAFDSSNQTVTIQLQAAPAAGVLVRLIVRGTGLAPLLGRNGVPLAGAVGGPPGGPHDGYDFVHVVST